MTKDYNTTVKGYKNAVQSNRVCGRIPRIPPESATVVELWWRMIIY